MNNSHRNTGQQDDLEPPLAAPVSAVDAKPLAAVQQPAAPAIPTATAVAPNIAAGGKLKVAILLPLSGPQSVLGQSMLNAAQQAVFDVAPPNFELMPRDTGANDEQADSAARDAVVSGAQLLIGPLFASQVPLVRRDAASSGIGMLTLSSDTSMAGMGVYVMGFAPAPQVERVVSYAATHGAVHFAALVPNNAYGQLVAHAFRSAVERAGGDLVTLDIYDPIKKDSAVAVHDLATHKDKVDALFLPEGGDELALIGSQLTAAGFNPQTTHILGTGLWDVPGTAKAAPIALGGWYAASDPALRRGFSATYASTYGQEPPRLVTLAYDATALAAVLAKRGSHYDTAALTNPNGFAGLDGIFRLQPNGLVERGLAVLQVTADSAQVIEPGPITFAIVTH